MPSYENWCRLGTGLLAVYRQDYDGALEHFERIFQLCSRSRNPWFACQAHLGMALVHLGLDQKDEAINPACCWLDILAFKELVEKVADAVRKENADQVIELARNALDLYRGPFLSDRSDEDWTFAPRSDFTHQFRSLVECVGNLLEEKKGWASADRIYQEAISKDPVCEIYCQRRMVCLSNMGNANLALRVYDECRERLERLLGEKPSPQTTHLRDQILSS